jgi:catechol 2,3-dioxygenase-like lactoylglutathione lyase family enzyme
MASRLTEVIVDCHDLATETDFWCAALGYERTNHGDGWIAIRPPGQELSDEALVAGAQPPALAFVEVPEGKDTKNRVHIDVTPIDRGQADEVDRLVLLGASRVDIGQGATPWIVMADPEGNEFCVMPAIEPATP